MIARRSFQCVALLLLAAAAACSDSTAPRSPLSRDEAAGLAMQLNLMLTAAMPATAAAASRMGLSASSAPEPVSLSVDQVVACPMGGESHVIASMTGTVDNATESMDVTLNGSQSPANCGFDVNGVTFHTTGDPSLESTAHVITVNGLPSGAMTFSGKGKFNWTADDGRSPGSCSVDYSMTLNYTTNHAVVHGSFCGVKLDYDGPMDS